MSYLFSESGTPRRKRTPPADPTLMRAAQKENFAIFLLRGILSVAHSPMVRNQIPAKLRNEIEVAAMQSIMLIKDKQAVRMLNAGKEPQRYK